MVTTSMGGINDWQIDFSQLENEVKVSQKEIKSLYHIIEQLEKRLGQLEAKGEFGEAHIQPTVPNCNAISKDCPCIDYKLMSLSIV